MKNESLNSLTSKVASWLQGEGYPLEYTTAATFHHSGFRVFQGRHVRTAPDQNLREVDVIGVFDDHFDDHLLRIEYIVECKWSRDKPWVVFTSPFGQMSSAACINQTIASELGNAALWLEAGSPRLAQLASFATPKTPGFGGRQALSQQRDVFYSVVQSVVTACSAIMTEYNRDESSGVSLPYAAVVGFPVVVIDGELFEAFPENNDLKMSIRQVESSRVQWKGSAAREFHSTLDLVTVDALSQYVKERAKEAETILKIMRNAVGRIKKFSQSGKRGDLRVRRAARGTLGLPPLIARVNRAHKEAAIAAKKRLSE